MYFTTFLTPVVYWSIWQHHMHRCTPDWPWSAASPRLRFYYDNKSARAWKPTKSHERPANTQISQHIRAVWSVFAGQEPNRWLWSDYVAVRADLSLCGTHMWFRRFCHALSPSNGRRLRWSVEDIGFFLFVAYIPILWQMFQRIKDTWHLSLYVKFTWFILTIGQTYLSRDMTKPTKWLCAQQRLRSAWASAQSDQRLRFALNG